MQRFVIPFSLSALALAFACVWGEDQPTAQASRQAGDGGKIRTAERVALLQSRHLDAISIVDDKSLSYGLRDLNISVGDTLALAQNPLAFFHLRADSSKLAEKILARYASVGASLVSYPVDLEKLSVKRKKALFFSGLTPIVKFHNDIITERRRRLLAFAADHSSVEGRAFFLAMVEYYALDRHGEKLPALADSLNELLTRVDIVPPSLVLAQAAIESGWGTSRFARRGNNLFGQRVWRSKLGGLQAAKAAGARFRLAIFKNIMASVISYTRNLNSHPVYAPMRVLRAQARAQNKAIKGEVLAAGLVRYSTRGKEYVKDVRRLIKSNKLGKMDSVLGE